MAGLHKRFARVLQSFLHLAICLAVDAFVAFLSKEGSVAPGSLKLLASRACAFQGIKTAFLATQVRWLIL